MNFFRETDFRIYSRIFILSNFNPNFFVKFRKNYTSLNLHFWIYTRWDHQFFFFKQLHPTAKANILEPKRFEDYHDVKTAAIRAYFTNKITAKDGPAPA